MFVITALVTLINLNYGNYCLHCAIIIILILKQLKINKRYYDILSTLAVLINADIGVSRHQQSVVISICFTSSVFVLRHQYLFFVISICFTSYGISI